MKKKIALMLGAFIFLNVASIVMPKSFVANTVSTIVQAEEIPDNTYTDELGTFRVMVRITSDDAKVKDGITPFSKTLFKPKRGELYNYRGNNFGSYLVHIGKQYGEYKNNYEAYLPNKYGEVVKLYDDGRIVLNNR